MELIAATLVLLVSITLGLMISKGMLSAVLSRMGRRVLGRDLVVASREFTHRESFQYGVPTTLPKEE